MPLGSMAHNKLFGKQEGLLKSVPKISWENQILETMATIGRTAVSQSNIKSEITRRIYRFIHRSMTVRGRLATRRIVICTSKISKKSQ